MFYFKGPLNWVLMVLMALAYVFHWELTFSISASILFFRTAIVRWLLLAFIPKDSGHYERHKDRRTPQERGYW
jgi:hypothetical protein